MNLSGFPALDAAIGLAALFFLLSTVCSSINEGISSALGWRAKTLEDGIRNMLGEPRVKRGLKEAPEQLTDKIFDHWRVKGLVRDPHSSKRRRNRPSYLPPRAFSRALAEVVAVLPEPGAEPKQPDAGPAQATLWDKTDEEIFERINRALEGVPNPQLRGLVDRAAMNAEAKLDGFRDHVETAFNDSMERASGWYKRKVQVVVTILAAVIAIGLNVDTVRVGTYLLNNGPARAAVAAQAGNAQSGQAAAEALKQAEALPIPVGWGSQGPQGKDRDLSNLPAWSLHRLPGWILTVAALSLGAPFWFDLLSRFARLRSAGLQEKPRALSDTAGAKGT
jgi:hypothetical protein